MAQQEDVFKKIVSHAKEYGFVFPSSEIYDGLSAVYDYGQNGVELKNNIKRYWWDAMTLLHENIVGIDSAIFMHPTIWKASGHVDAFNDPLIDNRDSKKRYRAAVLTDGSMSVYLRPETAQGIFVNYLNVQKTGRMRIPFGIAQIGKAFRNEIVARQFIFRMREFEQMEMQFFVRPGEELTWFSQWKEWRLKWHKALGLGDEKYRYHDHDKLAHYANAATDIEFQMPFGFKEVEGIHSRTNFDLSQHEKFSGKKIQYFDPEINESYTPYVIETSIGVDRMFLSVLCSSYEEEQLPGGDTRVVLHLPAPLAPVKCAVLPLVRKDGLPEKAREIVDELKFDFATHYEEKDAIGKRYRRQDAIGTPYCITVDHQTLEDNTVTLRERDSMEQTRVAIDDLHRLIHDRVSLASLLRKLK